MTTLMGFLHVAGFTFWLGGAFALMMMSIAARRMDRRAQGTLVRLQAAITRTVVTPGAAATVVSGIILTFRAYPGTGEMMAPSVWLMVMQGTGLVAGVLTLALTAPTAMRLARIDPEGPHAAAFDALRKRQKIVGASSGILGLIALAAGVFLRYGI